jgi:hypothetical protein
VRHGFKAVPYETTKHRGYETQRLVARTGIKDLGFRLSTGAFALVLLLIVGAAVIFGHVP